MPFHVAFVLFAAVLTIASIVSSVATLGHAFPGVWLRRAEGRGRDAHPVMGEKPAHATK
jgi:hypothetical protein